MFGCDCFYWNITCSDYFSLQFQQHEEEEQKPFSLPSPLPKWPPGQGFATGRIRLGEIEVLKICKFEKIWNSNQTRIKSKGVTFYKPSGIPEGFFSLGYYCQSNDQPLRGYVLVARDINQVKDSPPPLKKPVKYTLLSSLDSRNGERGYFWLPNPPKGYKAMGFVVTDEPDEPELGKVRCVRDDLTESCEPRDIILESDSSSSEYPFRVWTTRPCKRGIYGKGVDIGTFFCCESSSSEEDLDIACLKNLDSTLHAMPNSDQVHALIDHYGPRVYFHPDEIYLPSSVHWYFKNGALLYREGENKGEPIDYYGSNLPSGGKNDGKFWIDLPVNEEARSYVKKGNLDSAELYVHVKPALGGTFTDIAMWVFCPFNGPATIKAGLISITLSKIGEHIGDWEHFTLRLSNFTGELSGVYFSQHIGGEWVDASTLEYFEGNRPTIYSSRNGHASFPHPGSYVWGPSKLGIGLKNDVSKSNFFVDSNIKYEIVAAEYLGDGVVKEPCWLQYIREWGPSVVYDSRSELDKLINLLPVFVRFSVENIFDLFPTEIYGEEGPTGPKEKDNWLEDERC